jgi:hypothetical protein
MVKFLERETWTDVGRPLRVRWNHAGVPQIAADPPRPSRQGRAQEEMFGKVTRTRSLSEYSRSSILTRIRFRESCHRESNFPFGVSSRDQAIYEFSDRLLDDRKREDAGFFPHGFGHLESRNVDRDYSAAEM